VDVGKKHETEDILEGLRDEEDRILSLNPTPRQPCAHPHTPPH